MRSAADALAGVAVGIIACAWFLEATPQQVGAIRFPAKLYLIAYCLVWMIRAKP